MNMARILIVAGSDSGGGAGIQADIKTVTVLGGFAMTAVTAITVQNTQGVSAIHAIPADIVTAQMRAVLDDIGADAIKIGMLGNADLIEAVSDVLADVPQIPVILDPVMVAKGGAALLPSDAVEALRSRLLPQAFVVTPNLPEAAALTGVADAEPHRLAGALAGLGAASVLIKGGHGTGDRLVDTLLDANGVLHTFETKRIETRHTHGTGCTMASALATFLAQGEDLPVAVQRAQNYVRGAILHAPGFGNGHGPLDHGWIHRN